MEINGDGWLAELKLKRAAQRTNVYLCETFDQKRIGSFRDLMEDTSKIISFLRLEKDAEVKGYEYDMQRHKLFEFKNLNGTEKTEKRRRMPVNIDLETTILGKLDKELDADSATVVIVDYVFSRQQAEELQNYLMAWSQDTKLHNAKSTIIVFTADTCLFSDNLRRFFYQISIEPSTAEERKVLLEKLSKEIEKGWKELHKQNLRLEVNEDIIQASAGLDIHSTETAAIESFYLHRKFEVPTFTDFKIKILNTYGIEYVEPTRGFSSVGGYRLLKEYITKRIIEPVKDPERAKRYGLETPRGILMFGPPGTGKTWLSKALSREVGLPMIKMSPSDLLRGIVGESESRVKQVTRLIESLAPVVVLLDEFDQIAMGRASTMSTDSGVFRRVENSLLEWLGDESRRSFIIGATNLISQIDPAFLRPGRIDKVVVVLLPDAEARAEILKVHTSIVRNVPVQDVDFDDLAKKTKWLTGAELERLVLDSAAMAMDANAKYVTMEHFNAALKLVDLNQLRTERERNLGQMINEVQKLENVDKQYLQDALKAMQDESEEYSRISSLIKDGNIPKTVAI